MKLKYEGGKVVGVEEKSVQGSITIPSSVTIGGVQCSVTSIGEAAFVGCSGLKSVEIPSGVTSIGDWAFDGCSGLKSVEIPSSVTSIGKYAFSGCSGLKSVEIQSGVTSIGEGAFSGCSGLESVEIPSSVTSIGQMAFAGCRGLESVVSLSKKPQVLDRYVFSSVGLSWVTLYVPKEAVESYKKAYIWKDFGKIVEMEEADPEVFGSLSLEFDEDCADVKVVSFEDGTLTLSIKVKEGHDFDGVYVNGVKVLGPKDNKASSVEAWWNEDGTVSISGLTEKSEVIVRFSGDNIKTAVKTIRADVSESWYEMSGRKLAGRPTRRGVYVHNGKLEMVK